MAIDTIPPAHALDVTLPPSQRVPKGVEQETPYYGGITFYLATQADGIPAWGSDPIARDQQLRDFWPSESLLASSICSQIARYASFPYNLDGPARTTAIYESIFEGCENGEGWIPMMVKVITDLYTCDNGAFIELIRTADAPNAPVVSMRHKDSGRCRRTGKWDAPVIYWDLHNKPHLMKWYQIIPISEMPCPIELYRGLQYSVLTRLLKTAQTMKAIQQYMNEEVSGLNPHEVHLIGGFNQDIVDATLIQKTEQARNKGNVVYVPPVLLAALRPDATVTHEVIKLSSLPPDFDVDKFMKWYIQVIALAWEDEYGSFAPLPGGNLGTAQQSQTMADKARSKGPAMFMRLMEHKFNFYGVLPRTVKMRFGEQDPIADMQATMQFWRYSQILTQLIESGTITPEIAALLLRDAGFLKKQYLDKLGIIDPTPQAVSSDLPEPEVLSA